MVADAWGGGVPQMLNAAWEASDRLLYRAAEALGEALHDDPEPPPAR